MVLPKISYLADTLLIIKRHMIQKEFLSRASVIIGISRLYTYIPIATCELLPSREMSTNHIIF